MPSTLYVNQPELALARSEAADVIENALYREQSLASISQDHHAIRREAEEQAEELFSREEFLTNLLRTEQVRNPGLAREIEEAVHDRILGKRNAHARAVTGRI